ncbi:MAG: hypothetical protein Q7T80_08550 [Methanoregula sp.]|nr:hypothetical protein [Methanoregula sp.]
MKGSGIFLLTVAILISFLLFSGCSHNSQNPSASNTTIPGIPADIQNTTIPSDSRTGASGTLVPSDWVRGYNGTLMPPMAPVTAPPSDPVSVYKGVFMSLGMVFDSKYSMSNISALKKAGVNTVAIGTYVKVNSRGEAQLFTRSNINPNSTSYYEFRLAEQAKKYYENGIRLYLVPDIYYEPEFSGTIGEPMPIPPDIAQQPGFLNNYTIIVRNLSILAEKYHVEFFSPMNEPDRRLGTSLGSSWGQAVLPEIRKKYHGKVVYKAAYNSSLNGSVDFTGYDVIGFSTTPAKMGTQKKSLEIYKETLNQSINDALERAQQDGVPEVFLSEIGVWASAQDFDREGKVQAHRIAFEQGKGRVQGFFVADPITGEGQKNIIPLRESEIFDEMSYWFNQGLMKK